MTTELLCAYSRLILGPSNADALELPDNKVRDYNRHDTLGVSAPNRRVRPAKATAG